MSNTKFNQGLDVARNLMFAGKAFTHADVSKKVGHQTARNVIRFLQERDVIVVGTKIRRKGIQVGRLANLYMTKTLRKSLVKSI